MYYYIYNGQNDIVGLTDKAGNTVVYYLYDAWGNILSVTGTMATTLGVDNPFRYRGYFYDEETKFYYLQSRYYDPKICRFINADDFKMLYNAVGNVLGGNLFAYCMNNPVMNSDKDGNWGIPVSLAAAAFNAAIGILVGFGAGRIAMYFAKQGAVVAAYWFSFTISNTLKRWGLFTIARVIPFIGYTIANWLDPGGWIARQIDAHDHYPNNGWID